jgi:hypothetical protein
MEEEEEYNDIVTYIQDQKNPLVMFDLQVSPQYISEDDNETESEN